MKLLSIEIENFLSIEERQELQIADQGLVLIDGKNFDEFDSNGSGKSTLINAIVYGAYGRTLHSDPKPKVEDIPFRGNSKTMTVKHFYEDGYVIERNRRQASFSFKRGDFPLTKPRPEDTQKDIERVLFNNLSYEHFSRIFVYDKKSIAAFINGSESENKRFVENIFKVENYDTLLDNTKILVKRTKAEIEALQLAIPSIRDGIETHEQKRREYSERASTYAKEHRDLLESIKDQIFKMEQDLKSLNSIDRSEEYAKIKNNERIDIEIKNLSNRLIKIEAELEIIDSQIERWEKIKDVDVEKELAFIKKQKQIDQYLEEAIPKQTKLETELAKTKDEINEQNKVKDINVPEEMRLLKDHQDKKEKLFQKSVELRFSINSAENEIKEKLSQKKSEICPNCNQKILNATEYNNTLSKKLDELRVNLDNDKKLLEKVLKLKSTLKQPTYSLEQLQQIETMQGKDLAKKKDEISEELDSLQSKIGKCKIAKQSLKYSENELSSIAELQSSKPIDHKRQLEDEKESTNKAIETLAKSKIESKHTIKDLESIERDIVKKQQEWKELNVRFGKESTRKNEYAEMVKDYERSLEESKDQLAKKEQDLAKELEYLKHYSFWQQAFDKNGIKMLVLSKAIEIINSKINHYLSMLGSSHQVKYDNNLDEVNCHYATTSTSERQRINIALLFCCLEIVLNTFNLGFLCIDEVFDGMDRSFTPNLMETLKMLSKKVGTIFLITHNDEIKSEYAEYFDKFITVQKKNGRSTIVCN